MIFVFLVFCLALWLGGLWFIHFVQQTRKQALLEIKEQKRQQKEQRRILRDRKLHPEKYAVEPSSLASYLNPVGYSAYHDIERRGYWVMTPSGKKFVPEIFQRQFQNQYQMNQMLGQRYDNVSSATAFTSPHSLAEAEMLRQNLVNSLEMINNNMRINPEVFQGFLDNMVGENEGLTNEHNSVDIKKKGGE